MKIVIPDDYQDAVRHLDSFSKLGDHQVTVYNDMVKDVDMQVERFQDADALVLIRERTKITESLLARLPKLKLISQTGKGHPHIDIEACTRHGVAVTVGSLSPVSGSSNATAELTWGLIIASMRHLPQEIASMKAGHWQSTLGVGLRGRTLGIFGFGHIGSVIASYGRAFGMDVLVWGREGSLSRARAAGYATASNQRELFAQADVLTLHIGLNEETRGIVTAEDLAAMKPTSRLINTSRAPLIAHGVLENALRAGHPGYAAVDVYEDEPVIDHPLLHMENVICTPHLGYVEKDGYELLFGGAFDLLLAFAAGKPAQVVNPQVLSKK